MNRARERACARTLHTQLRETVPQGAAHRSVLQRANFGIGVQMDGPRSTDVTQERAKALEGYTVHLLSLDGTITTVRKEAADDTVELTVEVRDRKGGRRLPAELAENTKSPEFRRVVREVKAELLDRRKGRRSTKSHSSK